MSRKDWFARGAAWFRGLDNLDKWAVGDALVLDTFDWMDWLDAPPKPGFLDGADAERVLWEEGA